MYLDALLTLPQVLAAANRPALPLLWWLGPLTAVAALVFAWILYRQMLQTSEGNERMQEIAQAVREGAMAYLRRQYRVVTIVFVVLFAIFLLLAFFKLQNPIVPFAFLTGGLFSGICGYIGMKAATNASARTAFAATRSLNGALQVALRGGAVMGLVVVGFALLDITVWFYFLYKLFPSLFPNSFISVADNPLPQITAIMLSFGMGASTQALFARVGGGIYTKAADVGADLVGKVEANIPEDDPRNPATIADNVGDNVGDVAGMGADLYESYAGSILATAALGVAAIAHRGSELIDGQSPLALSIVYATAPIVLAALGIVLSILAIFAVRSQEEASQAELIGALSRGLYISSAGIAVLSLPLFYLLEIPNPIGLWIVVLTGLAVGIAVGRLTEYYTSHAFGPTRNIASHANTSTATALIEGLAVGMRSSGFPVLAIAIGIVISFYASDGASSVLLGLYGIGLAAVSMLSTLGFTLATDAYGPIADNAGGNAEMSKLDPVVRARTDQLDAVGNTTAAIGKGFAIGSAALTAMALLAAYLEEIRLVLSELRGVATLTIDGEIVRTAETTIEGFMSYYRVTLLNPAVLVGVFVGVATVFYFSAMTMSAVGRAAGGMVDEVRRQFREIRGILEGTTRPDYARCVEISTIAAQREMLAPALLAIVIPVAVGVLLGVAGVLGLLAGGLAAGFSLALMMSNAGGAWDNAKKYIESGEYGGRGSNAHKAAVVGDTVGDPFKDTAGPSLNILIKLMSMVSVVFAGLIAAFGNGQGLLLTMLQR
ncbi:MAG: sodium-translocating pyrophosphatase [Thermoanaerobaculia bacterium]|nr:sodium-translocating pyrophosphatase [Thermoanaerobaculia bacterium]MBP7813998.1 sodium-translocating pyrophosphatase [Thermoanaerobaculia bacterium]MBP8845296.1 sodium-translocating pyrophosphatase [Thermoanaerobaculia bacterium]HQN38849.1 sodium-translocating pyrophosphatase [Thermoanaerobaculia bacterium]HRR14670.1 sodium-translocating pyrophosphatase [Thermoanaerobaculia bacterium]